MFQRGEGRGERGEGRGERGEGRGERGEGRGERGEGRGERGEGRGRGERGVRLCLCKDDKVSQGVRVANLYETKKKKKRVDLKYNSPLVDSVPWYNDRVYRGGGGGVDSQPCSPTIHFVANI